MAVEVETLEKLERKIKLTLPAQEVEQEVQTRLKRLAKQVKIDGFRPGKVPFSEVAKRYGYSVQYEVVNDKVGEAFNKVANEGNLRVAGLNSINESEGTPTEGQLSFDAIFEVYPEVQLPDLGTIEIEKFSSDVDEAAVERTVELLRKQRRSFAQCAMDATAKDGDRATIDFEGKIDGEPFAGGKAEAFQFIVGEGQMLKEFEDAVRGMKVGESKTFPLNFPADYHGQEVAGKQADFMVTIKKLESQHLPEVDSQFVKSLGVADATPESLRADIRKNLEREVKARLIARNKSLALDALANNTNLDLPQSSVQAELRRMGEAARADLKSRGVKDADKAPIPEDIFRPQAERRVKLGLVVAELVKANGLEAKPEQVSKHIEEIAASYEKPIDVIKWYGSDRQRMAEVEAVVLENNVSDFILSKAKVQNKTLAFDELMAQ